MAAMSEVFDAVTVAIATREVQFMLALAFFVIVALAVFDRGAR